MLFVSEIGSNHKGIQALAYEMIRKSKEAGADIVKFQLDRMPGRHDQIRNAPNDWMAFLIESCEYYNIEFMASIWSLRALNDARGCGMKRYKIAHQLKDLDLIREILSDRKETFWSNPSPEDEAQMRNSGFDFHRLYCSEQYPMYFRYRPDRYFHYGKDINSVYGYSDHTCGIEACLLAIAQGAKYIEKHFTLDKTEGSIKDNAFSATPDEFAELVKVGRNLARLI